MTVHIPVSPTPAAALTRLLDNVPKGYTRYTCGTIKVDKIRMLVDKFRIRHSIHASPAQRFNRKKKGQANALLTVYCPSAKVDTDTATEIATETNQDNAAAVVAAVTTTTPAQWLLQFTSGELDSPETLLDVTEKPRLQWLGYEFVQHTFRGNTSWTWRRNKEEIAGLFGMLAELCQRQQWREVERFLQHAASQPGFHAVREQTWRLCQEAKRRGYDGLVPHLYYMQKIKHGEPFVLHDST